MERARRDEMGIAGTVESEPGTHYRDNEVLQLKEENARLKHRLQEIEMGADLRERAARILAIPFHEGA